MFLKTKKIYNPHILFFFFLIFILGNLLFIGNYTRISINDLNYYYAGKCIDVYNYLSAGTGEISINFNLIEIIYGLFLNILNKSSLSISITAITLASTTLIMFYKFAVFVTKNKNIAALATCILLCDPVIISSARRCWPQIYAAFFLYLAINTIHKKTKYRIIFILLYCLSAILLHYSSIIYITLFVFSSKYKNAKYFAILILILSVIYTAINPTYFSQAIEINSETFKESNPINTLVKFYTEQYPNYTQLLKQIIFSGLHYILFFAYIILKFLTRNKTKQTLIENRSIATIIVASIAMLYMGKGIDSLFFGYSLIVIDVASIIHNSLNKNMIYILIPLLTLNIPLKTADIYNSTLMKENRINNLINIKNQPTNIKELKDFLHKHKNNLIAVLDAPHYNFAPYALKPMDLALISTTPIQITAIYPDMSTEEIGKLDYIILEQSLSHLINKTMKNKIDNSFTVSKTIKINKQQILQIYKNQK